MVSALLVETDLEPPHTSSNGQGLEPLYVDPIAQANKPAGGYKRHGFDTFHLSRFDGTDLVQWYGRRISGYFYPYGKVMRLTEEGLKAIAKDAA